MQPGTLDALIGAGRRSSGKLLDNNGFADMRPTQKGMPDVCGARAVHIVQSDDQRDQAVAVKEHIDDPVAEAVVYWRTAAEGGRLSGPLPGPMHRPTTVFVLGGESEVLHGWPWTADPTLTTMVERTAIRDDGSWLCKIDFLARDLASPYLGSGAEFLLMEGSRVVATARFTTIYDTWSAGE
jgi:hypothetical protein